MKIFIVNLFVISGMGAISYGAWLAWPPLGFVAAGAFLILIASAAGKAKSQ